GENALVNVIIEGYETSVALSVDAGTAPLSVSVNPRSVRPNAKVEISISALPDAKAGRYVVLLSAAGERVTVERNFEVVVGQALGLSRTELPEAYVGGLYEYSLEVSEPGLELSVLSDPRDLPAGLRMDATGTIEGIPRDSGVYRIPVEFRANDGRNGSGELLLRVFE